MNRLLKEALECSTLNHRQKSDIRAQCSICQSGLEAVIAAFRINGFCP